MERIWLKNYPAGVPHDVDADAYPSVAQMLEESFHRHADSPFSVRSRFFASAFS